MQFMIALLAALAFFLFLTLGVAKDPQKRNYFYLYLLVDIWLTSVFIYLIYEALID
jgi:hypothetical protein